jgi:methoxymalonate biosynthesis acyl carrier protein
MRDRQRIENEIAEIFFQKLHVDIPHDCDLFEKGILDSLQLVELLYQLEQQFGARISMEEMDIEHFRSIERIAVMLAM